MMSSEADFEISGNASREQESAIIAALEVMLRQEESVESHLSAWKLSGRAISEGIGIVELRHQLPGRAWVVSGRINSTAK